MAPSKQTTVVCSPGTEGSGPGGKKTRAAPRCPDGYSRTQKVLHSMFMEDAGGHMLDSGDFYGRAGDAYRETPDLRAEPKAAAHGDDDGDVAVRRSTFHMLDSALEFSEELDRRLDRYCARVDTDGSKKWTELAEGFAAENDKGSHWDPGENNTYYFDNPLDAAFEWFEFDATVSAGLGTGERKRVRAALVQVHLGCDIRGGYGRPRAFVVRHGESLRRCTKSFNASCKCTEVECWGNGTVLNDRAASECEACAYQSDEDRDKGLTPDGCICGEWPDYWKASGRGDGSIDCGECGKEVDVS